MRPKRPRQDDSDSSPVNLPSHIYLVWEEIDDDGHGRPCILVYGARRNAQAAVEFAKSQVCKEEAEGRPVDLKKKLVCEFGIGMKVEKFKLLENTGEPSCVISTSPHASNSNIENISTEAIKQYYAFTITTLKDDGDDDDGETAVAKLVGVTLSMEGAQEIAAKKMNKTELSILTDWSTAKEGAVVASGHRKMRKRNEYVCVQRWKIDDFDDYEVKSVAKRKRKRKNLD
ncbi:hypothetical protein BT69DRAFT_1281827, partial [Atractiella rhizophila]